MQRLLEWILPTVVANSELNTPLLHTTRALSIPVFVLPYFQHGVSHRFSEYLDTDWI
jgi:hypothetical protein